jgi:DNA-binding beta-propeller fold protein YncE
MINKQKLYSIALVSTAMILMLTSIAGAAPFAYILDGSGNTLYVRNTSTDTVTASEYAVNTPNGIAVNPAGTKVESINI